MIKGTRRGLAGTGLVLLKVVLSVAALGQTLSLSGSVKDTAGHAVPSATVSAKNVLSGKLYTTRTSLDGTYAIPELKAGDYKVWADAGALRAQPVKVTLAAGLTTDLVVSPRDREKKK